MKLEQIFDTYTPDSLGFAIAVETHCGFPISRDECMRIGWEASNRYATNPKAWGPAGYFLNIWENEDWWQD